MNRRTMLASAATALAAAALPLASRARSGDFEIMKSESEWRNLLSPEQFRVLREEGTERPFTSPLNDNKAEGTYHCAGCDLPLYESATKYDSKTGWPSFWQEIEGNVGQSKDYKLFIPRTEVHCARCGGHQGHVFTDGPKPTGLRHCINGVALVFRGRDGSVLVG